MDTERKKSTDSATPGETSDNRGIVGGVTGLFMAPFRAKPTSTDTNSTEDELLSVLEFVAFPTFDDS